MKKLGYRIFAMMYYIFYLCPIQANKVFCVMTHDASDGGNVGVVIQALKKCGEYRFIKMQKNDREFKGKQGKIKSLLDFFVVKPYHLATSAYILQDNLFLPMAYLKLRRGVKDVQLWHGTGTIKKFGQSANEGELKQLEYQADQNITHLIINSKATRKSYKEAFAIQDDKKVYELGLPRTDIFFDQERMAKLKEDFYQEYPMLEGKKLVLYAPTFRDSQVEQPEMKLDLDELCKKLPENYCVGLRLHPFVARNYEKRKQGNELLRQRVFDFSLYDDLNPLLAVADVLITDYSSIIFEYCVLEKPMIFYAYDYEDFKANQRGFYESYEEFVPGPIAYSQEALERILIEDDYNLNQVREFKKEQYRYLDGKATNRLLENVFEL